MGGIERRRWPGRRLSEVCGHRTFREAAEVRSSICVSANLSWICRSARHGVWNLSGWDVFDEANIGAMNGAFSQQNVNNGFAFSTPGQGVELSGGRNYAGYHYSFAVVNQNTSGSTATPANVSPVVGVFSDSNFKDVYGRFSYRFNLERDPASRHDIQAAGTTGPRDHTYLNLGSYYFYGRSVQRFQGLQSDGVTTTVLTAREPFYRAGGDFSFNYRTFNLFGVYMLGRDHNLVPIGPAAFPLPTSFVVNAPAKFSGGFLEADYLALPWVMTIMRWDVVNSSADRINGIGDDAGDPLGTSFFSPFNSTRHRFTPGVQLLIHANIKASFEYQIRPQQIVYVPGTCARDQWPVSHEFGGCRTGMGLLKKST